MKVTLRLACEEEAYVLKNLWPLYQHDLSKFEASLVPNPHGLLGADDGVRTLEENTESLGSWWGRPDSLFPYLILVDGCPVGFNMIAGAPSLPEGIQADWVVHEFFVLHPFRGREVAEKAAIQGFQRHRGKWEVVTWPENARAIAFWRRVVQDYALNAVVEEVVNHPWGRRVAFRFDHS